MKYKDPITGQVIEIGSPELNPDLIKGKTLVPDTTPLGVIPVSTLTSQQTPIDISSSPTPASLDITNGQNSIDSFTKYLQSLYPEPSPTASSDLLARLESATGLETKQQRANADIATYKAAQAKFQGINAQLAGINAEAQAIPIQTQQEATGRGITASGLAPITAGRLRENALRAIPLQTQALVAQAEAASAQGNAQLSQSILEMAQAHIDKVFQLQTQDATNQYNYRKDIIDKVYSFADKLQQRQLDNLKIQEAQNFSLYNSTVSDLRTAASSATANGQGTIAGQLATLVTRLNPNSKTFQQDLQNVNSEFAKLQAQIVPKSAPGSGKITSSPEIQLATAKANVDSIQNIMDSKGLASSVGTSFLTRKPSGFFGNVGAIASLIGIPSVIGGAFRSMTGERQDFIAGVEQIRSQLNLDKLIQSKAQGATFGALSDNELQVLASAGTKLGTWAIKDGDNNIIGYNTSESAFRKELDKINNFAKLDYIIKGGNPTDVNAKIMPDGTIWTVNNDGTYTQIK